MRYYSNKIFLSLIILSAIATVFRFYFFWMLWALAGSGGASIWDWIFGPCYLLQIPIIVLIICLQQYKGYRKLGYLMIFFMFLLYFYIMPLEGIQESLLYIPSIIIEDPASAIYEIIFILANLIPVYVLAKTGYEDLRGKLKK